MCPVKGATAGSLRGSPHDDPMTPRMPEDRAGTDDELSALLLALRRHMLSPDGAWDPEVREAAKKLSAAIAARLEPTGRAAGQRSAPPADG